MRVLVAGGAGFLGSHPCVPLLQGGLSERICSEISELIDRIVALRERRDGPASEAEHAFVPQVASQTAQ